MTALGFCDVRVTYNGTEAVQGFNDLLHSGEWLCLIGPNGAGKSTTLLTFLGFLSPSGGSVQVNGREVGADVAAARGAIAYLPEAATLYGHLDAYENLAYFLDLAGRRVDRAALEALPGVGRKTANVVLNTAFGEPTMAVDTHIFRVSNRTGLAPGKTVRQVEDKLLKAVPAEFLVDAHHWLILHGRYVCKARKPDCPNCVVRSLCRFRTKTP